MKKEGGLMVKLTRLWIALALSGMFLTPPTVVGGMGDTAAPISEPLHREARTCPPEAAEGLGPAQPELVALLDPPLAEPQGQRHLVGISELPECREFMSLRPAPSPLFDSRQGPNVHMLDLDFVSPPELEMWMWTAGVFAMLGKPTQINVTFNNSGHSNTGQVTTWVAIEDIFGNELMNQTQYIANLAPGENQTLYWYWTPPYVTYWVINIHCDCAGDTNVADNDYSFGGLMNGARFGTALWADTGVDSLWSGDKGNGRWHITDSPMLDDPVNHTAPDCWYHGRDGIIQDSYDNNLDISIRTQNFDFRSYTMSWFLHFNYLFHGGLAPDPGDVFSQAVSKDNGASWEDNFVELDGIRLAGAPNLRQNWYRWYTDLNGDQQAQGNELGLDIRLDAAEGFATIRSRFVSNAALTDTGLYFDDFIIYGQEVFDNVKVEILNDIEDTKVNETETFNVRVTNVGSHAQPRPFNCTLNVTKRGYPLNPLVTERKDVPALAVGGKYELSFTWRPTEPGDYVIRINVSGMVDYDSSNNLEARWVHVSGEKPRVLVVNDNPWHVPSRNTEQQPTLYTTDHLLTALNELGMDYGMVFVPDDMSGPSLSLMSKYEVVIWTTGWDNRTITENGTLSPTDESNLKSYLNGGGALWLISMEAINDLGKSNSFVKDYLHVGDARTNNEVKGTGFTEAQNVPILPNPVDGVPGSLAAGMSCPTWMLSGTNYTYDWTDILYPDTFSRGVFFQNNSNKNAEAGPFVALQYAGAKFRTVFQSFDLAFMMDSIHKKELVKKALEFLTGGMSMEVLGGPPGAVNQQTVNPGESAVYTIVIRNGGIKTRIIQDTIVSGESDVIPEGWTAVASPLVESGEPPTQLEPGEELEVTLTVTPPAKALANTFLKLFFNVTFKDYPVVLSNVTITTVAAILGTSLRADVTSANITKSGTASYSFRIKNEGNLMVTAELSRSGEHIEWLELSSNTVLLNAFEERPLSAILTVPEGAFRYAGNYTILSTIISRVSYQEKTHTASLNLTTRVIVPQVFWAKFEDVEISPSDGHVDMTASKPSVRVTVSVTAERANSFDNVSVELKAKSFTPSSGPSQSWSGTGWTLPKTVVEVSPFMTVPKEASLTILVPPKAEAGEYTIELRLIPGSGMLSDGDTTTITVRVLRPDLVLVDGSLSFTPKEPQVGQPVKIKVTVRNTGGVAAKDVQVKFFDSSGNEIGSDTIANLAASVGSAIAEITWEGIQEGENEITVRVDPDNLITETVEDNNELTDVVTGLLSDIVIDSPPVFRVGGVQKTKALKGEVVTVEVVVKNLGNYGLELNNVPVRLVDQTTQETLTQTIGALPKKGEVTVTFTWTASKTGTHTFLVTANPDGTIFEKSSANNEATGTFKVESPPAPTMELPLALVGGVLAAVIVLIIVLAVLLTRRRPPATAPSYRRRKDETVVEAEEVTAEEAL
ncbi:MAG: CARDB domain-containing protein [Thermoplasmata archaeon]